MGKCPRTSPGPDGLTTNALKQIPRVKIRLPFNVMLYTQYIPTCLKKSRTTLIPKGSANLQEIDNWRPITISSILLRLINRLMAERLKAVELNCAQRGFSNIDGCLANNLTVQTIIKRKRKTGRGFVLITLDLRKAFDAVSHESMRRALNRTNIDDKTKNYVMSNLTGCDTTVLEKKWPP